MNIPTHHYKCLSAFINHYMVISSWFCCWIIPTRKEKNVDFLKPLVKYMWIMVSYSI